MLASHGYLVRTWGKPTPLGGDGFFIFPWTTSLTPLFLPPINSPGKTLKENSFTPWELRLLEPRLQLEKAHGFSPGCRLARHNHIMAGDARENWWLVGDLLEKCWPMITSSVLVLYFSGYNPPSVSKTSINPVDCHRLLACESKEILFSCLEQSWEGGQQLPM